VGVATMYAASVTELSHFGLGGEAPILIRTKDGKVHSIAGVGTMPKMATAEMFRNRPLQPFEVSEHEPGGLKGIITGAGLMPALVPGMVDGALVALREYGTMSFEQVIAPAIDLADGFALDDMRSASIAYSQPFFNLWPTSKAHFLPNGRPLRTGEIFRQPDLARTLRGMAEAEKKSLAAGATREAAIDKVRDYFYRGEIAHKIDAFSRANGGLLRYEDMAAFKVQPGTRVDHFQGLSGLQERLLESGSGDDRGPEHIGRLRRPARVQFGRLYSPRRRSVEAGLCGSRHLLRRSQV